MEYEKMLDRLYASLPKETLSRERFKMPEIESFIQGNKTFVKNVGALIKMVKRDDKHFLKFVSKETATAASLDDSGRLVLNRKFVQEQAKKLVENYLNRFVLCPECKKPDTHITEKQGVKMLKCEACGAVSAVKGL